MKPYLTGIKYGACRRFPRNNQYKLLWNNIFGTTCFTRIDTSKGIFKLFSLLTEIYFYLIFMSLELSPKL